MKTQLIIFSALLMSIGLFGQSAKKSYRSGLKLLETNQFSEAIDEFNHAIQWDGTNAEVYAARAKAYEKVENPELAAKDYEKAAELAPKEVDYIFEAGKNNYKIKNYDKALQYFNEALALDNNHFQAYLFKSFTHIKLKDYSNAVLAIDNALRIDKTYLCYYTRAIAIDSLHNYNEAIIDYINAIDLNSEFEEAFFSLTKAYLKNNDFENAMQNSDRTVHKFPSSPEAYEVRSLVYYNKGELPAAINDLSKVETLVTDPTRVLFKRGMYYFEYRQYQNAKSDFSQLLILQPSNYLALYWTARANEELMELQEANMDYLAFINLSEKTEQNAILRHDATIRLFELNKEKIAPIVVIDTPIVIEQNKLAVLNNAENLLISGKIEDASKIISFTINNQNVNLNANNTFSHSINLVGTKSVEFFVADCYKNETKVEYTLLPMEIDAPVVQITKPYAGDNNEICLNSKDANLYVEGNIKDASLIKDIFIDSIRANFLDTELNPQFWAKINIQNKNAITIKAIDGFGNTSETKFTFSTKIR